MTSTFFISSIVLKLIFREKASFPAILIMGFTIGGLLAGCIMVILEFLEEVRTKAPLKQS